MYIVRLSWLPLPNRPKVFTCREGDEERDRKSPHAHKRSKALPGRDGTGQCEQKGVPDAHPTLQQGPSLAFSQGLSPLPAPGNRHGTGGGKLPRHFSPAFQGRKKNRQDFSINVSRLKSILNQCAHPSLFAFPLGAPIPHPSPPSTGWSEGFRKTTRDIWLRRMGSSSGVAKPRGQE